MRWIRGVGGCSSRSRLLRMWSSLEATGLDVLRGDWDDQFVAPERHHVHATRGIAMEVLIREVKKAVNSKSLDAGGVDLLREMDWVLRVLN